MRAVPSRSRQASGRDANSTDAAASLLVHELVEARADNTPHALAVAAGRNRLSYLELNRRASALAGELSRRGAGPDRVVAVLIRRSPDLVVAQLAVLKAG